MVLISFDFCKGVSNDLQAHVYVDFEGVMPPQERPWEDCESHP